MQFADQMQTRLIHCAGVARARKLAKGYLCVCALTESLLKGLKDGICRDHSVLADHDVDEVDEEL